MEWMTSAIRCQEYAIAYVEKLHGREVPGEADRCWSGSTAGAAHQHISMPARYLFKRTRRLHQAAVLLTHSVSDRINRRLAPLTLVTPTTTFCVIE